MTRSESRLDVEVFQEATYAPLHLVANGAYGVDALVRGEGKWEHTGRTYRSIVRYWHVLDPILKVWLADGIESLREITRDEVKRAIATRQGTPARSIHIVLRNVFRAFQQEGVIFCDPTRGLVFSGINKTPPSVPSDRLAGVLSHARTTSSAS
ncbi:hypothetical protein PV749_01735 [Streptomyces sp. ID03-2B]|uniref:Transposase n=1 Tax=Streptomyces caviscabies TaxID=90079 RepID=A0ABW2MMC9_9ACTN|nr:MULTISPECIES: hypothetical protein [unclassified Streptomyces]MCL6289171.1 hypothetical protein [Streptomyces sp. 43Y-GA-1]MDX3339009.1 hypothetical protein [Streptomyces sp. ME02-6979.5a]MDX3506376.1 hypothetical protein [Streptomyces sp. ATCC51928]MDX3589853.1 hypothetical protein [Streptomyces sp. ID03-2B]MDX5522223.1 hypothetical protein [Streptomyces sp. DE06-01C]